MNFKRITALFLSAVTAVTAISTSELKNSFSAIAYADGAAWSETDGTYTYTHTDEAQDLPWLDIDITDKDWSAIKYVSADIEVTGTVFAAFGGSLGEENWHNCTPVEVTDSTKTIYLDVNGNTFESLEINFDNDVTTSAGTVISISNIKFSTEDRDYSNVTSEWYSPEDGVWCFRNGDTAVKEIPGLELDLSDTDWSQVKYISADIETAGTAMTVFDFNIDGTDDGWKNGSPCTVSNGKTTIYYNTKGEVPAFVNLSLWQYDENEIALAANQLLTVNNIVYSTEERDYSNVIGEWYSPEDGVWCFRNGDTAVKEIPGLELDLSDTDWSQVKYISADIETAGTAMTVFDFNIDGTDDGWKNGSPCTVSNGKTTIYYNTKGEVPAFVNLSLWQYDENEIALAANQLLTVNNIVYSTEERDYSNVIGEWYSPEDGVWCFRNGDKALSEKEMPSLELPMADYVSDWSKIKYISANVKVEGNAIAVIGGEYDDKWKDSSSIAIKNGSDTVFLYTEGETFKLNTINFWNTNGTNVAVSANAFITISDITASETYVTDYKSVIGQWVKTNDGQFYYNHGNRSDIAYVEGIVLDCPYDMADVQSISITAKVVMTGGTPKSIKLTVSGDSADGGWHAGYNFAFGAAEQTVLRKYRGAVVNRPSLDISFGQEDLAVIENGGNIEIYVSDISFSTEPINNIYSTPNDLLIDDNETDITGDNEHDIMFSNIVNIETAGTLKIYTKHLEGYSEHKIRAGWREWSDFSNITILYSDKTPVAIGDGEVYEVHVTEEVLNIIHEKAPAECELMLDGVGYKFLMATFTPDSTASVPKTEEVKSESLPENDKAALEQSKGNTVNEFDAPKDSEDFEYGKAQGHKSGLKKNKKGHNVYGLRIVERISKEKLKHAESVTITVYSKKADQYLTLTADTCFSYLNINGVKVKAGGNDAFLTVILDNIPEDDEISFTCFTINYKK